MSRSSERTKSRVATVLEGQAQACDLAGEVLGVGQVAFGAQTVLLGHDAVAGVLAVLREHNQGGRVRGLG